MPKPTVTPKTPLREQLCQIEQSLGVCHVAEVTPWPDIRMRPEAVHHTEDFGVRSPAGLIPLAPRKQSPFRVADPSHGTRPPGFSLQSQTSASAMLARTMVHQPQPPRRLGNGLARSSRVPRQDARDNSFSLDEAVALRLEDAVSQLVDDVIYHPPAGFENVVSLGSPQAAAACGRLPQQLADMRFNLRKLGSYCDSMQSMTTNNVAAHGRSWAGQDEPTHENMEIEHASVMDQARLLLERVGNQNPLLSETGDFSAGHYDA